MIGGRGGGDDDIWTGVLMGANTLKDGRGGQGGADFTQVWGGHVRPFLM